MKRSGLKRSTPLKRMPPKSKARIDSKIRSVVWKRQERRCVACGVRVLRPQIHHVLPQSQWFEHAHDPRNMVAICPGCHDNHERAHRRIRYDELPEQVRTWVRTLGGRENMYLERTYPRA
jgi:5-methylcytosine-specific restriction endonuclease McrA